MGVELQHVKDPQFIAHTVSMVLPGLKYTDVFTIASLKPSDSAVYAVLAQNVTQEDVDKLKQVKQKMQEDYEAGEADAEIGAGKGELQHAPGRRRPALRPPAR